MAAETMPGWSRLAIVGHSFPRRLKDLILRPYKAERNLQEELSGFNLSFNLERCEAKWFVEGGLSTESVLKWRDSISHFSPDVVVVMVGDNDYAKYKDRVEEFALLMTATASVFVGNKIKAKAAVLCQVMPRFPGDPRFKPDYNRWAMQLNALLESSMAGKKNLIFWKHTFVKSFWKDNIVEPCEQWVIRDGVHLNNEGQIRLYKSIRDALRLHKHLS